MGKLVRCLPAPLVQWPKQALGGLLLGPVFAWPVPGVAAACRAVPLAREGPKRSSGF